MHANYSLCIKNVSAERFRSCFKYRVNDPKELNMSGFSGEAVNNFFWIQYHPKRLSFKNIMEWQMPTILEGRIYPQKDGIKITYYFDKKEFAKAISYGTIGFAVTALIGLFLELYSIWYDKIFSLFLGMTISLIICSVPFVIAVWSLRIGNHSKQQLEKVLCEIIKIAAYAGPEREIDGKI